MGCCNQAPKGGGGKPSTLFITIAVMMGVVFALAFFAG